MKTIKLTDYEVDIKNSLTWGDKEEIQQEYMKGMKIQGSTKKADDMPFEFDASVSLKAKCKLIELSIKEIRKDDKKVEFSKDWLFNLPSDDGDKLYEEVDKLYSGNKKKD